MYAHQVIEDLKTKYKREKEYCNSLIKNIQNSQKFNLPDLNIDTEKQKFTVNNFNIEKTGEILGNKEENMYRYLIPPYNFCWFDYKINKEFDKNNPLEISKTGVLVIKEGDILIITSIYYLINVKIWTLPLITYYTNLKTKENWYCKTFKDVDEDIIHHLNSEQSVHRAYIGQVLLMLNCKNIGTIDINPPQKLNKKRIKGNKQPLFTYKNLIINPIGKKRNSNNEPQNLWDNRIHMCRGHFKHYVKEKPLFGKYTGMIWWQPQARGNKKKGVVMKDYKIKESN